MALEQTVLDAPTILRTIAEHGDKLYELGARQLGLFGSFVRGEQTPDSDIDILVKMARPSYKDYSNIHFYLEDLFERRVDLVIEDGLREELRPYIMSEVIFAENLQPLSA